MGGPPLPPDLEKTNVLDPMQGRWLQLKGLVQQRWERLSSEDLDRIAGMNARLADKLQARYGFSREDAERQVDDFTSQLSVISEW